ncbi:MAG TPA: DUF4097 family beta strand repeat-containing protein [Terriglobales bacterium]|nr:DUF4097 family beta strand repeat-containing protein [Terriglobales bacterium]
MERLQQTTVVTLVLATCLASAALAESRKEYRFQVGPKANISVDTQYGAISVKPGTSNEVVVTAISQSDKTEVDQEQRGNRIEIATHLLDGADAQTGRVDYELLIPADATLSLRSSTGPLSAEDLQGDLSFEGTDAVVNVRDVSNGHVHVTTMDGPITLSDVKNGHVEISSISGAVALTSVTGPYVRANSGSGKIFYNGDFGSGGDYKFTTHSGDIEALVAGNASADFSAHSMRGKVRNELDLIPQHSRYAVEQGRAFFGHVGQAASKVVLRSFSGKIRLKQR